MAREPFGTTSVASKLLNAFTAKGVDISDVTFPRPMQPSKALDPIAVTLLGMVMAKRLVQPLKAFAPIAVTLLGIETDNRLVQSEKASSPIDVNWSPNMTEVMPPQPRKAFAPIVVTLFGITVFLQPAISVFVSVLIIALQLSRESKAVFSMSTTIDSRALQPSNSPPPILVTLLGIIMDERLLQPLKAPLSIFVTLLGIVTEERFEQPLKA